LEINANTVAIFQHPSSWFEQTLFPKERPGVAFVNDFTTEESSRRLYTFVKNKKIPAILTLDNTAFASEYYFDRYFFFNEDFHYIISSDGGTHQISFKKIENLILSGGNIFICLCRFIADSIKGSNQSTKPVNLILVKQAIYGNFEKFGKASVKGNERASLNKLIEGVSDEKIINVFKKRLLGIGRDPSENNGYENMFCDHPFQQWLEYSPDVYSFNFFDYAENNILRQINEVAIGHGSKKFNFIFVNINQVDSLLKR